MNVAMIGKWHVHAEGYANELKALPHVNIVAVCDKDQAAAQVWADSLGAKVMSFEDILKDESIDSVAVCTATNEHPAVLLQAIEHGKSVFTEKVLTLSYQDALKVRDAVRKHNTHFTISFPHKCNPLLIKAKELVQNNEIGQVTYMRVRNVHNGSVANWLPPHFYDVTACGGGAMIDLGAHPMYTLCDFLGTPKTVQSLFTSVTNRGVEDNAVSLLSFENGVIGVSETGFVSTDNPYTLEISGTKGYILVQNGLFLHKDGKVEEITDFAPQPASPIVQWAQGVDNPGFSIDHAVLLSLVMESAYQAQNKLIHITE